MLYYDSVDGHFHAAFCHVENVSRRRYIGVHMGKTCKKQKCDMATLKVVEIRCGLLL